MPQSTLSASLTNRARALQIERGTPIDYVHIDVRQKRMQAVIVQTSLLGVGFPAAALPKLGSSSSSANPRDSITMALSAREAIQRLRLLRYDLLIAGTAVPDMPWKALIGRVRTAWPQQRWAMFAPELSVSDEVAARAFGAIAILQQWPHASVIKDLLESAARRASPVSPTLERSAATEAAAAAAALPRRRSRAAVPA